MAIEVATWNIDGGFSDLTRAADIIREVAYLEADVVVLPEAYNEGDTGYLPLAKRYFETCGYSVAHAPYKDEADRTDHSGIMMLSKLPQLPYRIRLGSRNALVVDAKNADDEPMMIWGVHLDDQSAEARLEQAHAIIDHQMRVGGSAVVAGDLNAFRGPKYLNQGVRGALPLVARLRNRVPESGSIGSKLNRLTSVAQRAGELASGSVIDAFIDAGFIDADGLARRPTARLLGRYSLQLDHILTYNAVAPPPTIIPRPRLSDHAILRATIGR